jgi:hypothetical protein
MTTVGISGARKLSPKQAQQVRRELTELMRGWEVTHCHVGDAAGVDAIACDVATRAPRVKLVLYEIRSRERWAYAERSTRMVKGLAAEGGTLHAWVNKPCPPGLSKSKTWKGASGSGTWGTVALAVGHGLKVELHWLTEPQEEPDWMIEKQLSLV